VRSIISSLFHLRKRTHHVKKNLPIGVLVRAVGTGENQIPDMNSFLYSTDGNGSFVIRLPGGIVIQGANFTTDSNGYKLITMGVAMSDYQAFACEDSQAAGYRPVGYIHFPPLRLQQN
jgi:hypothetical protein